MRTVVRSMQPEEIRAVADLRSDNKEATPLLYMEVTNLPIYQIRDRYTSDELITAKLRFEEQLRTLFPPIRAANLIASSIVLKRINAALVTEK